MSYIPQSSLVTSHGGPQALRRAPILSAIPQSHYSLLNPLLSGPPKSPPSSQTLNRAPTAHRSRLLTPYRAPHPLPCTFSPGFPLSPRGPLSPSMPGGPRSPWVKGQKSGSGAGGPSPSEFELSDRLAQPPEEPLPQPRETRSVYVGQTYSPCPPWHRVALEAPQLWLHHPEWTGGSQRSQEHP